MDKKILKVWTFLICLGPIKSVQCLSRAKTGANASPKEKPCIICDQIKCQGDTKKFRICEKSAAKTLLKAANFNKNSVYTR